MANPFRHVDPAKAPALLDLNRRGRGLAKERRKDLDGKHEEIQKAVSVAFGKKQQKLGTPKASPQAAQLKHDAAVAVQAKAEAEKKGK